MQAVTWSRVRSRFDRASFASRGESAGTVRSILLTTGNADAEGVTGVIIDSLLPTLLQERIRLRVVIGPLNASKRQLHKRYSNCEQVELLENVTNMAVLMRECDIAVSACGTTLYELAACGVPTVGFSMVPEPGCKRGNR